MAMSPDEVRNKTFHIARRGYERGEVHRFLENVAGELEAFTHGATAPHAEIVDAETVADTEPGPIEATVDEAPAQAAATVAAPSGSTRGVDDFDRVGNEISLMLRQAQESALKIRNDAESEARTLVDQVRLDIEADRSAHEQAAQELIARTEERATALRRDAESYAEDTRRSADEYASARRADADKVHRDAELAVESDRRHAAEKLEAASIEAEATVREATLRAESLITDARAEAAGKADALLRQARSTLATLVSAERMSRTNLEDARALIDDALGQTTISEFDPALLEEGEGTQDEPAESGDVGEFSVAPEHPDTDVIDEAVEVDD